MDYEDIDRWFLDPQNWDWVSEALAPDYLDIPALGASDDADLAG